MPHPGRTEQHQELSVGAGEVDSVDGGRPVAETFGQSSCFNGRHRLNRRGVGSEIGVTDSRHSDSSMIPPALLASADQAFAAPLLEDRVDLLLGLRD